MSKAETVAGFAFAAVGACMAYVAFGFPYMLDGVPGPGFLPRWIAAGLVGTGLALAARALRPRAAAVVWPTLAGWGRIALMFCALAVALLVLEKAGFLVTTTLFVAAVIFGLGVRSWLTLATVPIVAAVSLYVVFAVWLKVPLPKGILAFLG